jgi:hypothetical protein
VTAEKRPEAGSRLSSLHHALTGLVNHPISNGDAWETRGENALRQESAGKSDEWRASGRLETDGGLALQTRKPRTLTVLVAAVAATKTAATAG